MFLSLANIDDSGHIKIYIRDSNALAVVGFGSVTLKSRNINNVYVYRSRVPTCFK